MCLSVTALSLCPLYRYLDHDYFGAYLLYIQAAELGYLVAHNNAAYLLHRRLDPYEAIGVPPPSLSPLDDDDAAPGEVVDMPYDAMKKQALWPWTALVRLLQRMAHRAGSIHETVASTNQTTRSSDTQQQSCHRRIAQGDAEKGKAQLTKEEMKYYLALRYNWLSHTLGQNDMESALQIGDGYFYGFGGEYPHYYRASAAGLSQGSSSHCSSTITNLLHLTYTHGYTSAQGVIIWVTCMRMVVGFD